MRHGKQVVCGVLSAALLAGCGGGGSSGPPAVTKVMPAANPWLEGHTPVDMYGRLKVCGTHICASDGETEVQLRGMSLFWSNTGWGGEAFYNADVVDNLADQWNATVIRAAIGALGGGDYNDGATNKAANLARARAVIDAAIAKGMYVIVDWHSHTLLTPQAQEFFGTLSAEYKDAPNVIWETFNEPPGSTYTWPTLKTYHEAVIGTIRAAGSHNLVVVGSPTWSQDVDVAAADPVVDADDDNVAYTLHFYAHTHGAGLRTKADTAMSRGAAIFVTEWGDCDASGNGGFDPVATQPWLDWMDSNLISSANWSMNSKAETASALRPGNTAGPWTADQLTDSGWLVMPYIHGGYANTLQVSKAGTGTGAVTSSPAGLDCESTCSYGFTADTAITLTAAASGGGTFAGWSGACSADPCVVTMDAAKSVTATFTAPVMPP